MKTLLLISLLASTMALRANPISIASYTLPADWPASEFSHTIGSPRGGFVVPYSFAAILTQKQIASMGTQFSKSNKSSIKIPNQALLTANIDPEYKPQGPDDIGITFSVKGPGEELFTSKISLPRGSGFVLRYSPTGIANPLFLLIQIK